MPQFSPLVGFPTAEPRLFPYTIKQTLGVCGVVRAVLDRRPPSLDLPSDQKPHATPTLDRTPIERLDIVNTSEATRAIRLRGLGAPFPRGPKARSPSPRAFPLLRGLKARCPFPSYSLLASTAGRRPAPHHPLPRTEY